MTNKKRKEKKQDWKRTNQCRAFKTLDFREDLNLCDGVNDTYMLIHY